MSLEERIIPALAGNTQPPWWSSWFHPDHPRSRGEYVIFFSFSSTFFGSSPLSRGIRVAGVAARGRVGIIPALAGNTPASRSSWSVAPDHPRSRGEYPLRFGNTDIVVGSSPLSRGIHFRWWTTSRRSRIIPALAGNTLAPCRTALRVKDHPRSRGEYASEMSAMPRRSGSSPLSRGIQSWCRTGSGSVRIIPALAGNTHVSLPASPMRSDHPRSRGEYLPDRGVVLQEEGSSPLSRGIRGVLVLVAGAGGIIPALAGNTWPTCTTSPVCGDHPRSRGEYYTPFPEQLLQLGSSPLSRGILPNCANTHTMILDHPRSRGEYPDRVAGAEPHRGSSPLSRGILRMLSAIIFYHRIIPALAGNTVQMAAGCTTGRDHPRSRGEY